MDLGSLLRAHAYLRVERPPELWEADVDDVALVRVLGEMIAAALARGAALGDVVLRANNVTVERGTGCETDESRPPAPGEYVALTVVGGEGSWVDAAWWPGGASGGPLLSAELETAIAAAGIPFAYSRSDGAGGSATVFLRRATP